MFAQALAAFLPKPFLGPKEFFLGMNQIAEPLIRAGVGNPILLPVGTIVVETIGRKTGRKINVPVLAMRIGDWVVFSTVRRSSHWIKNLAANPEVRFWLAGKPHKATAFVFTPDENPSSSKLPSRAVCLAQYLQLQSRLLGISFALLTPRR
jgi:deazaflavin-dependent oxidoreductase (nitroreductase family)